MRALMQVEWHTFILPECEFFLLFHFYFDCVSSWMYCTPKLYSCFFVCYVLHKVICIAFFMWVFTAVCKVPQVPSSCFWQLFDWGGTLKISVLEKELQSSCSNKQSKMAYVLWFLCLVLANYERYIWELPHHILLAINNLKRAKQSAIFPRFELNILRN